MKTDEIIRLNNLKACKEIFERAKNCSEKELSKDRPFCRKIVLYTMRGYNLSNAKQLLELHKKAVVYLGLGEIRECFKMIKEN